MTPPMYDVTNIDLWKFKIGEYLKTLGFYVYLATTKKSYLDNDKYIEANTQTYCFFLLRHLGSHLTKIIFLWFLIVIPLLQCGLYWPLPSYKRKSMWR